MKRFEVWQSGRLCASYVFKADTFFARLRGLMFRSALMPGEGLLLSGCSAIHCCFMRFPIDAVYLSKNMTVIARETVKPWRVGRIFRGTKNVLELEAGAAAMLENGETIEIRECD